jgi:hypothetical protein
VHSRYPKNYGLNPYHVGDSIEAMINGHYGRSEPDYWIPARITYAGEWFEHYRIECIGTEPGEQHSITCTAFHTSIRLVFETRCKHTRRLTL